MNVRFALVLLASAALVGCATDGTTAGGGAPAPTATAAPKPGAAPSSAPSQSAGADESFKKADFAWSASPGRGGIEGQLTFKQGAVAYNCVDLGVALTPETPWVRRRMQILYNSADKATLPADEVRARTPPERNQDYTSYVKRATCDAAGHFAFSGLADGAWYVITVARPVAPATGAGIAIMRRVTVKGDKIKLTL
jgi:hypothetical protein